MDAIKVDQFRHLNHLVDVDEDSLFCGNCENWLTSQIIMDSNGNYFCRSCVPQNSGWRVVALENIMKNFLYPCLHVGCDFVAKGDEIHAHMEDCKHAPSNCCLCDDRKMDLNSFKDHLKSKHADAVINMDIPVLTIPLKQLDTKDKFVAILKSHMFLVYITINVSQLVVNVARLFKDYEVDLDNTFSVYLRCGNNKQKITKKMVEVRNISKVDNATDINANVINMTQIEIFLCKYNKVTKLGECPICEHYLGLLVYQCSNGHNVCNDCGKKITACAICRNNSINLVNCEFLFPNALITCTNAAAGCLFIGEKAALKSHLNDCSFSATKCFVCNDNICKNDFRSHLFTQHRNVAFENNLGFTTVVINEMIVVNTFYIVYSAKVFAIGIETVGPLARKRVGFSCKLVGSGDIMESERYKFEIQILDKSILGRAVYVLRSNCQLATDNQPSVFFYYDSWKKYMLKDANNVTTAFFRCVITQTN